MSLKKAGVVALFGLSGCECDRIDPPIREVACDNTAALETQLEVRDPCATGEILLPATIFQRTVGPPNDYTASFLAPHAGTICVRIHNGSANGHGVSAAWLSIDGPAADATLVSPADLNRHSPDIERRMEVPGGAHSLSVRLASTPASELSVEIRFVAVLTADEQLAAEEASELRQAACLEWNENLALLSAEEAEERRRQQVKLGVGPGELRFRLSAHGTPRRLEPLPPADVGQEPDDSVDMIARRWLAHFAHVMKLTDPRISLPLDYIKPSKYGPSRVRFRQQIAGLPVDNGYLELVVNVGQVRRLVGNLVPPPDNLQPSASPTEASSVAVQTQPGQGLEVIGTPKLVVYDRSLLDGIPRSHLAWRVVVGATNGTDTQVAWIDAHDLTVVATQTTLLNSPEFEIYKGDSVTTRPPGVPEPLTALRDSENGVSQCFGDDEEWCSFVEQTAALFDVELRFGFGRSGWSGDGLPALPGEPGSEIPAEDHYRIVMDPDHPQGGTWFYGAALEDTSPGFLDFPARTGRRPDGRFVRLNAETSFARHPPANSPSRDPLRHEFGHGLYQVEVGLRGSVSEALPASYRYIAEHAAQFWTIADDADDTPFFYVHQVGSLGIDETRLTCEVRDAVQQDCQLPPLRLFSNDLCATYEHMNGFMGDLSLDRDVFDWEHRNACILDRVAYRAASTSIQLAHGVSTRGLGTDATRFIFHDLFTEQATITDDIIDYADNYRAAVATLAAKCDPVLGTGGDACPSNRDALEDGIDPLWGVGFYSAPISVTGLAGAIQTNSAPAVVTNSSGLHLFYINLARRLHVATFDDPIDRSPPIAVRDIGAALAGAQITYFNVAHENDDTVLLVFVTDNTAGQNLHVAHVHLAPFSVTIDPLPGPPDLLRAAQDRPAIIDDNGWLVIYAAEGTMELMQLRAGQASSMPIPKGSPLGLCGGVPPDSEHTGSSPALTRDPLFDSVLLVYRNLIEPGGFPGFALDLVISRRLLPSGFWCFPIEIPHLEPGGRITVPPGVGEFAAPQLEVDTFSVSPPAIAYFPPPTLLPPVFPRLQVFSTGFPSSSSFVSLSPPQVRQTSLGPPVPIGPGLGFNVIFPRDMITRNVALAEGGSSGVAVVPFMHPLHGAILLVYYRSTGLFSTHIFLTYKRSD